MDVGAMALLALCKEQDVVSYFRWRLTDQHFVGDESGLFTFVAKHVKEHNVLPQISTIEEFFGEVNVGEEPSGYYLARLDERFTYRALNHGLYECSELVAAKNFPEVIVRLEKILGTIYENKYRMQMVDFAAEGYDIFKAEYLKKHLQGDDYGILFGWPYLDLMTAGLGPGDVVSYVGRPAVGKTWKVLYTAHNAWWKQKKNVLVMSMEMAILPIVQRLTALHSHVNITQLKMAELSDKQQYKIHDSMVSADGHPSKMWIVDGNLTSTPSEIYALVNQLEPDVVFVDGAYLLRSDNPRLDRWSRVADNIEIIKRLTSKAQIPTICSYQFNREATKKKNEDIGLEHIGYSDAIGQVSSVVLGLFEEDNVETIKQRNIQVLKGRDGATGSFSVKWDFQYMDFSQVVNSNEDESPLDYV